MQLINEQKKYQKYKKAYYKEIYNFTDIDDAAETEMNTDSVLNEFKLKKINKINVNYITELTRLTY